jgi:phosphoglycolate phosphatase-like HAD superfamily hydrolase
VIRLVLFDIDGTLIRTGGAGVKAFERTFAVEFGIPQATRDVRFAGRTDPSLVRECFGLHDIPPTAANFQRFFAAYVFLLHELLKETKGAACAGVVNFITELQGRSHPPLVGLLTGNIRLGAEIKLRHYGLWDFFQCGAFGDDHEDRNQLAAVALQRGREFLDHSLTGSETLVVGDTPADVACGQAIGAQVLAVGTGGYSCADLQNCAPTWVVETLEAFSVGMLYPGAATAAAAATAGSGAARRLGSGAVAVRVGGKDGELLR